MTLLEYLAVSAWTLLVAVSCFRYGYRAGRDATSLSATEVITERDLTLTDAPDEISEALGDTDGIIYDEENID